MVRCQSMNKWIVAWCILSAAPSWADVSNGSKAYIAKQYEVAFAEFSKAAAQGDVLATRYLAIMYFLGQGTGKDERRGMELSRKCAQAGDSSCMVQAAESALLGRGTPVNLPEARDWARKALRKRDVRAGLYLAQAHLSDPDNRYIIDGKPDRRKYEALARRTVAERADQIEALDALALSAQEGFIPARLFLSTVLYGQSGGMPAAKVVALLSDVNDLAPMYKKLLSNTQQVLALGETRASPGLVQDSLQTVILGALGQATRAGVKDVRECKDFKLTNISNSTPLQDVEWLPLKQPLLANTFPLKGTWTEDWTVNLCNASYTVPMQFQADGLGGAYHTTRLQR
jgi:hypothetical protein